MILLIGMPETNELLLMGLFFLIPTILISLLIGNLLYKRKIKRNEQAATEKAKLIIKEAELQAETVRKDKILEAKEKFLKMKQEFEEEANRKKNQIVSNEQKIKQREAQLSKELETLKRKEAEVDEERQSLAQQHELVKKRKEELDKFNAQKVAILEGISKLTADQARDQLVESLKEEASTKASSYIKDIMEQAKI
jgi:ribonuclease Y